MSSRGPSVKGRASAHLRIHLRLTVGHSYSVKIIQKIIPAEIGGQATGQTLAASPNPLHSLFPQSLSLPWQPPPCRPPPASSAAGHRRCRLVLLLTLSLSVEAAPPMDARKRQRMDGMGMRRRPLPSAATARCEAAAAPPPSPSSPNRRQRRHPWGRGAGQRRRLDELDLRRLPLR
jgi:hypothetical protein